MPLNARARIDDLLPRCDFRADYQILISAPPPRVYECRLRLDFSELWLTRMLMTLRTGRIVPRQKGRRELRQHLQGSGFVILDEVPNEELVIELRAAFGGRMADAVWICRGQTFQAFPGVAMPRRRGILEFVQRHRRRTERYFRPKPGSNASVRRHCGSSAFTGC